MPIADYKTYCAMLDNAKKNKFAYPAINISSMETVNAALEGFQKANSDGIISVSIGGASHASGLGVKDMMLGAISLANHVHIMAQRYDVNIALHTDHCRMDNVDGFLIPLIEETEKRRARGECNLFNSHMFDGSDISLEENMEFSKKLLERCAKSDIILEVEAGVFGGEEDGMSSEGVPSEKLYTTPQDMIYVYEALNSVPNARYLLAATFGNVHGVYKPGQVQLQPKILRDGQKALKNNYGDDTSFQFVFHGGSGSRKDEIEETLEYGVVKMNIDTDTQYAFTRPIVDWMFRKYDQVLKVDGDVGYKKSYDPRSVLKAAETGMAERVYEACCDLRSNGTTLNK